MGPLPRLHLLQVLLIQGQRSELILPQTGTSRCHRNAYSPAELILHTFPPEAPETDKRQQVSGSSLESMWPMRVTAAAVIEELPQELKHKVDLFYKVRHVMMELIDLRRQMLSGHLTQDQSRDVKRHITVRLDWGNEHMGLDLVPRKEYEMVDEEQISVSDLYKMHLSSRHSVQQSTTQGDGTRPRHGDPGRVPVPHHLLVNLKSFTYNSIGEDTDIFFSLYDLREGKTISEKFMVRLNKNGGPKNPEKVERLCALFTDLSNKDMKRDLYIVSQVIRTGRMLLNDSKKGPPHVQYRRPYGCAVLAMSDVLQTISELKEEKDFVLKVYTCNNENEWYQIHENIIRKSSTKYTAPSTNYGLIISLQLLRGDMEQVRRENPLIFSRGAAITRKLGFPDVIMPGDIRNDLYLTLERGDFERGGKSVQKNIEVTVFVLYADGEILKDCISVGSGEPNLPEHRSFVLYHNNSPRWSEVIKLPIPIDRFRGSHIRFEFRHCSTKDKGEKKLFGFAFTPLMREDGTTLSDESHELYAYKCDENTTFSNHALYLGLPCCKDDFNSCPSIPSSLIFQRSTKESFWISTQLSSTKLTQNVDLLALLKWKAHPDRVMDILGRLRHVSGEEIVKFLQDILDTLFSILDDNTDKYGPLVFQSLVFIINLLRDSKYFHFRPVMDTYIQKHFAGALAYKELIRCLKWYMDRSAEVVRQDHIQEAMRALEYLFKFIVQSRILYSRATCGMEEEQFRTSIQELFQSIRFVLSLDSRNSETLIFTQGSQPCPGSNQVPGPAAPLALACALGQCPPAAPGQAPGSGGAGCVQAWSSNALRPSPLSLSLSYHCAGSVHVTVFSRRACCAVCAIRPCACRVGCGSEVRTLQVKSECTLDLQDARVSGPLVASVALTPTHSQRAHLPTNDALLLDCPITASRTISPAAPPLHTRGARRPAGTTGGANLHPGHRPNAFTTRHTWTRKPGHGKRITLARTTTRTLTCQVPLDRTPTLHSMVKGKSDKERKEWSTECTILDSSKAPLKQQERDPSAFTMDRQPPTLSYDLPTLHLLVETKLKRGSSNVSHGTSAYPERRILDELPDPSSKPEHKSITDLTSGGITETRRITEPR
ncbi:unnamed protein product [Pleuronectes platessa]|uniref:C2 DOCK-type domain-containing protein n=1 Tax=Pleuronectes platessa TaxID=8262 RepID=A0A9N7UR46_PLEPL|nr:unnamed protein product [Pleuronectes platessa]